MNYYSPVMNKFTTGQMNRLIDLMGELQSLANGKTVYPDGMNRQQFWKRVAGELNSIEGGAQKNAAKWCKTWFDWKAKTKKKAKDLQLKRSKGEEQKYPLTRLEKRLMILMGYPFKTLDIDEPNILLQEPKMEYVEGVYASSMKQSDSDDEMLQHPANSSHADFLEATEDKEYSSKQKGKRKSKKRRMEAPHRSEQDRTSNEALERERPKHCQSEQDRATSNEALERERLRQRDEELRLKAVELKLREDEIRLKETELSKIDSLASIEEEKLKCFRDVVGLLRELVDRTKNGNPNLLRYHNNI